MQTTIRTTSGQAWATYEIVRPGTAIVEVTYPDGHVSVELVTVRNARVTVNGIDPLYETCHLHASASARCHGCDLTRFAKVEA
jgi:hypothetical protein